MKVCFLLITSLFGKLELIQILQPNVYLAQFFRASLSNFKYIFIILFLLQHGKIEFTGPNASSVHMAPAVFSSVQTAQPPVANPIRVPTHYQQNNKIRPSAFRYSGRSFTSHHLQPILPRPTSENRCIQLQEISKQPEKTVEPKVKT